MYADPFHWLGDNNMIYGEKFIYLHMGKTGGMHVENLFQHFTEYVEQLHSTHGPIGHPLYRHDNIKKREQKGKVVIAGKEVILGIRRLPDLIFSHHCELVRILLRTRDSLKVMYDNTEGKQHPLLTHSVNKTKEQLQFVIQILKKGLHMNDGYMWVNNAGWFLNNASKEGWIKADQLLEFYMEDSKPIHWLRKENLLGDFVDTMRKFIPIDDEMVTVLQNLPPSNLNPLRNKFTKNFSKEDIINMYKNNPTWTRIEREVYGRALCDE
jgi:hypothetical protein